MRAGLIFNVHVVRVPSVVIDRFVPEQPGLADWRLLSDRARRKQKKSKKKKGAEKKKHINKTKKGENMYTFQQRFNSIKLNTQHF